MSIIVGTPFAIDAGSGANGIKVARLTNTKAIVGYIDGDNNNRPTAVIVENDESIGTALEIAAQSSSTRANIIALSSSKALMYWRTSGGSSNFRVLNISGTTITAPGAILTASFTTLSTSRDGFVNLTSANSLFIYSTALLTTHAVVMSVSGNTVTEESGGALSNWAAGVFATIGASALSSSKVLVCYDDGGSAFEGTATILNISGTTVTDGSVDTVFEAGHTNAISLDAYSSTAALVTYSDNGDGDKGKAQIITVSGNTPGANTPLTYQTNAVGAAANDTGISTFNTSNAVVISHVSGLTDGIVTELNISGTTITKGDESTIESSAIENIATVAFDSTTIIGVYEGSVKGVIVSPSVLTFASMTKPASIDASGEFIYVALLGNGTPILTKISTALDADGITVFDPGAGSDIGVECGRFDADVVWVAGVFDGTNRVEKSEDAGSTFTVKDDGTFDGIKTFKVGPDSDDRVIVADTSVDIFETINSGDSWVTRNAASGIPAPTAMDRLDINVQEMVIATEEGSPNNINYTVNSGTDLEDIEDGTLSEEEITGVIVN